MTALGRARPWTLIESDDANLTLDEGIFSDYPTLLEAAGRFARSPYAYRAVVFDDDEQVRELDDDEQQTLAFICSLYGLAVLDA
jgi:hypothetical protein